MKESKSETIISGLLVIGMLVFSIISRKTIVIVFSGILFCGLIIMLIISYLINKSIVDYEKKKSLQYENFKQKNNKSIFETLFIFAYQDEADDFMRAFIKKEKLKEINALDVTVTDVDNIRITYEYKGFEVYTYIKPEKIIYTIDTPTQYDDTKNNNEFEKKRISEMKMNACSNIDCFCEKFIESMQSVMIEIETFFEENVIDNIFNGSLVTKLKNSSNYLKKEGYICAILSPLLLAASLLLLYYGIIDANSYHENLSVHIFSIILCMGFIVLFFGTFIYGINYVLKYHHTRLDIKNKSWEIINEQPKRVRIIRDQKNRYTNRRTLRFIKLYFKNKSLFIPFTNEESVKNSQNINLCCQECLTIQNELKYLKKSRIVIDGAEKYIAIVKKYLMK